MHERELKSAGTSCASELVNFNLFAHAQSYIVTPSYASRLDRVTPLFPWAGSRGYAPCNGVRYPREYKRGS